MGERLPLTGPQSLTFAAMIAMIATIGDVIGKPMRFQEIPPDVATQHMVRQGFPEPFAAAMVARQAKAAGQPALTTGEVERILGRPARTFAEWAADHADAFRAQDS